MNKTRVMYKGTATIKLVLGDKVVLLKNKNSGTDYLKKSICKMLSGNYGGDADIPQKIDLRKYDSSSDSWVTYLNQEIELTGKTFLYIENDPELKIDHNWVARFNAAIPYSAFLDPVSDRDESLYRLYLYGSFDETDITERYHDLAYIPISAYSLSQVTEGTQMLIEWNMQILNYGETYNYELFDIETF